MTQTNKWFCKKSCSTKHGKKTQSLWYSVFSFGSNCSALCIILHNMTTPPAALTSEKTKLFIREPRGTRVILNYINHRGNDLFSWAAYYWVSFSWSAAWHWSTPQNFCFAQGLLGAVGRGCNGRCGGCWVPVRAGGLCWVVGLQSSALVGTGTGFHGRKPQGSTPGIFTVLSGRQSATRCCQPTPHIPAVCKWSRILAKLQWLVVPVFYLKTNVCVSWFRHSFFCCCYCFLL